MTSDSSLPLMPAVAPDVAEELAPLIQQYIDEMPIRAGALSVALNAQQWRQLQRLAHQIRGSAGSYGFPLAAQLATILESAIRDDQSTDTITMAAFHLIEQCHNASVGATTIKSRKTS